MKSPLQGIIFTELVLETFRVSGLLTTEGDRFTQTVGLSSARWKILGSLARSAVPLTVPQIARSMGQTRQAVQRLVDIMNKDGLLVFLSNPDHKRAKLVTLTTEGKDVYTKLEEKWNHRASHYSSQINKIDLEIALTTLKKISSLFES